MPKLEPGAGPAVADVEQWLDELGLAPLERVDREGITSWDLKLDGLRRFDVRITLIFDPALALIASFRKSYRKLLHWNDDYPFAKFALAADERLMLTSEVPVAILDRDELGFTVARLLTICDQLLEESAGWLWIGGRIPDTADRVSAQIGLFARYAERLGDLRQT
jgi:hypothetical protein